MIYSTMCTKYTKFITNMIFVGVVECSVDISRMFICTSSCGHTCPVRTE